MAEIAVPAPRVDAAEARERFASDGYLPPVRLFSSDEAASIAERCWSELGVDPATGGESTANLWAWHQRRRWAFDLAAEPRLLDLVEPLVGPDIVLWAMACWYKPARTGKRIPWHQDTSYWPMEPTTTVTAWIALNECTPENGCLRVIPRSHRRVLPLAPVADERSWFGEAAKDVEAEDAVDLAMHPGEVAIFNEATLHGSEPNTSARPRLGISLRFSPPQVRFLIERWTGDIGRIRTFLVRGEDRERLNDAIRGIPPVG